MPANQTPAAVLSETEIQAIEAEYRALDEKPYDRDARLLLDAKNGHRIRSLIASARRELDPAARRAGRGEVACEK